MVQPVFVEIKAFSPDTVGLGAVRQQANIAARADAAALGMIDDDSADARILSPLKQGLVNGGHHARGECMNGFWAVHAHAADAAFSGIQDFIGHGRSMYLATIIRITWLVSSSSDWLRRAPERGSGPDSGEWHECLWMDGDRWVGGNKKI